MAKFTNPHFPNARRTFWNYCLWQLGYYEDPVLRTEMPRDFVYPIPNHHFDPLLPSAVWMGHCSFSIAWKNITFLTDPIWSDYCSPLPLRSLKRQHAPPIPLEDLSTIDVVLISHNHYDHLDVKTVEHLHKFHPEIQWIVPVGLSRWFRSFVPIQVIELGWWETFTTKEFSITAVPAQHFSGRTLWDFDKTHWNGYVFEGSDGKRVYFTGDTGYNPVDFKTIGLRWPHMDLSLIPIGTYVPRDFMHPVHCSPWDAVEIHNDVHSRLSLGMHWKTFRLSDEPMDRPPYDLYTAMNNKQLALDTFLPIEPGIHINW